MTEHITEKQLLRKQYRTLRQQITAADKAVWDAAMQERFCRSSVYRQCQVLFAYVATPEEAETAWILEQAWQDNKVVALPRCLPNRKMVFCQVTNTQQLQRGAFDILEPDAACPVLQIPETGGICLVPGLVFDAKGYRIGYGGGYYDRFLQQHPQLYRVGYCAEVCCTDALPREKTDLPVQLLITNQKEVELYGS